MKYEAAIGIDKDVDIGEVAEGQDVSAVPEAIGM
jgi:hypothetical protein